MRTSRLVVCLLLPILIPACGTSTSSGGDAGTDLGIAAGNDASAGADAGPPPLDPALFDCTSLGADGKKLPDRVNKIPIACALDPLCRTPMVAGHRGVGGTLGKIAPEDTLAAYRAAIALGIDYVETDPRPTGDGVIVNMHDTTVNRTTTGAGSVDQMTFDQVRALTIKSDAYAGDYSCEKVPTLEEILRTCKGRVVVLIDANKTSRVDLLVKAVVDTDTLDWAVFDTSDISKIDQALAIEPRLQIMNRPRTLAAITTELDHFAQQTPPRLPVIVELESSDRREGSKVVHMRGTRAFSDIFVEDAAASIQGNLTLYGKALDDGLDIVQTERPELVLHYLRMRGLR